MDLKIDKKGRVEFDINGNLAPGIYTVTIAEIDKYFSFSPKRKTLIKGLKAMLSDLKKVGVKDFYLDGSFATNKLLPGDFDACWDKNHSIDWALLSADHPELMFCWPPRAGQKKKYFGEACLSDDHAGRGLCYLDFFQIDRNGNKKGILHIKL